MQIDQPASIAQRIREARSFTGLSQERFAAEVGTSRRHLIRWEKDHSQPRPHYLRRIAIAAGVSEAWLAGDCTDVHPAPSRAVAAESRSGVMASNQTAAAPDKKEA